MKVKFDCPYCGVQHEYLNYGNRKLQHVEVKCLGCAKRFVAAINAEPVRVFRFAQVRA